MPWTSVLLMDSSLSLIWIEPFKAAGHPGTTARTKMVPSFSCESIIPTPALVTTVVTGEDSGGIGGGGSGGCGGGSGGGAPPPPPAPVCTGARNDSSKALSSSAVPSDSPSLSTCLPAHCKFNACALPSALPSTRTHPLSVSASRRWVGGWGREGERGRERRERE